LALPFFSPFLLAPLSLFSLLGKSSLIGSLEFVEYSGQQAKGFSITVIT